MKCWHCNSELIWGGDHDVEDDEGNKLIETNLSCPKCEALVLVYARVFDKKIRREGIKE
jgi:DNA-directed RNA polymerase subunit RPC12/RpoP